MPFKTFVAGEILTASDVNTFLGNQAISVFADATARDAAITSPVEGQFAFRTDDDILEFWDGSVWVAAGASPLRASDVSATTGSPTTNDYTDSGINYRAYIFNDSGSITFGRAGLIDVLVVGGGGGGSGALSARGQSGGGAGGHFYAELVFVPSTTATITRGAGGAARTAGTTSAIEIDSKSVYLGIGGAGGANLNSDVPSAGGSGAGATALGRPKGAALQPGGGNIGGDGSATGSNNHAGGGGGGAGAVGGDAASNLGGNGGAGVANSISGTSVTRAGGGAGASGNNVFGVAGSGGGGSDSAGDPNTGGGGSGNNGGGSGVIIVRVLA